MTDRRRLSIEPAGAVLRLTVGGVWNVAGGLADAGAVEVAAEGVEGADSSLVAFLAAVHDLCERHGARLDLERAGKGLARLVGLARAVPEQAGTGRDAGARSRLEHLGHWTLGAWREFDGQVRFFGELCLSFARLRLTARTPNGGELTGSGALQLGGEALGAQDPGRRSAGAGGRSVRFRCR
jgi:ABC-type transporter Mla MlaB component